MLAGLASFLVALPDLISLAREIFNWIKVLSGDDPAGFIKKSADAFKLLNQAKTDEEKMNAAKAIQSLISGM